MELWQDIAEFPMYSVSNRGLIVNNETGRILRLCTNNRGIVYVGLLRKGIQYKRSVTLLVANAFLPHPASPAFDTPIHLDGDRTNNRYFNLTWRPMWFARKYHVQFPLSPSVGVPIQELVTGEEFSSSFQATVKYGLLDNDILRSVIKRDAVWPTYQRFALLD